MIANDIITITGRDSYLIRQALELIGSWTTLTRQEIASTLMDAADTPEQVELPAWNTATDIRALLREAFSGEALIDLNARAKRSALRVAREDK